MICANDRVAKRSFASPIPELAAESLDDFQASFPAPEALASQNPAPHFLGLFGGAILW